jgi:hypothetical protein
MAYGQSLPADEIRSITGRAIPPEWTVHLLSMGKEPWKFKYLDDQLNTYRQQWQADKQPKIIDQAKVSAKIWSETPTATIVVATAATTTIPDEEVADEDEDEDAGAAEETIMISTIT